MAIYQIRHREHDHTLLHTIKPENLRFTLNLDAPHDISYEISADNPIIAEENTPEGDPLGAYQHDWYLLRDGAPFTEMAGMITNLNIPEGEEHLAVTGKSWLHYLERRHYPYDPKHINPPAGAPRPEILFIGFQQEMASMLRDVINTVCARPYSLQIDTSSLIGQITFKENWEIDFGDSEDIQSKFSTLAEGKPGFDYSIDENKAFYMYYPEYSDPTTPVGTLVVAQPDTIDEWSALVDKGVIWTDNGPAGTHVVATGNSLRRAADPALDPSGQSGLARGSIDGQMTFRRLDMTMDFGDVPSDQKLLRLTDGALRAAVRPQREVPIKVVPDKIPEFWDRFIPGNYFVAVVPLGAHTVTGLKKITSVECEVTNEGEELVELHSTLWRAWYDVDTAVGQL